MIGKSPTPMYCRRIIPTSQNSNTPEGLESQFFVEIRRISSELPHSTKLELRKFHRTRTDFGRASTLELHGGLPTCREVLRPLEPRLSLYSTKNDLRSTIGS
jgi:hypothetical protein